MTGLRCAALALALALAVGACSGNRSSPSPTASGPDASPSASAPPEPSSTSPAPSSGSVAPSASPATAFDPARIGVELEPFLDGFDAPLAVVDAGDGSGRLFVAEQDGRIRVVRDGRLVDEPILDISGRITAGGERGLLGLVFHPDFPDDPRLFVNYTDPNGDTVVSSFPVPDGGDRADEAAERILMTIDQPFANHNGGAVEFGPDGMLYVATGDGGSGGDPHGNGQRLDTHLGKILRIDVDATDAGAYGIPADNPFVGRDGAEPEIWHYGLRNPWRISFDSATGDLWMGDVGQGAWEEVDRAPAGAGGLNFGWNLMEGSHCFPSGDGCARPGLTLPVTEYGHDAGCTIIGGYVYRGSAQPALAGGYLFGDYCSGVLFAISATAADGVAPVLVGESGRTLSSFGEDEAGELYATDLAAGEVLRVVAVAR
jgi:glucose/arabinose dehydrogenase